MHDERDEVVLLRHMDIVNVVHAYCVGHMNVVSVYLHVVLVVYAC
jgi:hypothetical protein